MTYSMFDEQYRTLIRGPFKHYPESLYVQYILPCFIASYIDLSETKVSLEAKEKYLLFVDSLVKSYEEVKFGQELSTPNPKEEYFHVVKRRMHEIRYFVQYTQGQLKEELVKMVGDSFGDNFQNRLLLFLPDAESKKETISPWLLQQYMYLMRQWTAIEQCNRVKGIVFCVSPLTRLFLDIAMNHTAMDMLAAVNHRENVAGINAVVANMVMESLVHPIKVQVALMKNLSRQQVIGLVHYLCFKDIEKGNCVVSLGKFDNLQYPVFPLDEYGIVFWSLMKNDRLQLKIAASFDLRDKNGKNASYIPLELASTEPWCKMLINSITPKGKIHLQRPGAVSFFPIKHCRWCGLVRCNAFRLCPECKSDPEYPDANFFCSEECEKLSLDQQHREEHANYLLAQLRI